MAPKSPESLAHVVREVPGEPQGTLVLLHGRGADEHDLASVLDILDPERRLLGLTADRYTTLVASATSAVTASSASTARS